MAVEENKLEIKTTSDIGFLSQQLYDELFIRGKGKETYDKNQNQRWVSVDSLKELHRLFEQHIKNLVSIIPEEAKIEEYDHDADESWIVRTADPDQWRGFSDRLDQWLLKAKELLALLGAAEKEKEAT